MTLNIWIALAAANYLSAVAPGQNVALVSSATARVGSKGGYYAVVGILVADLVWCLIALALAFGAQEISTGFLTIVQVCSGLILLMLGLKIVRSTTGSEQKFENRGTTKSTILVCQGFGLGFANPLTLVFFLTLFPAFMTVGSGTASFSTALFYCSAILMSGLVALCPYIIASLAISKAGFAKAINITSGAALSIIGGFAFLQPLI